MYACVGDCVHVCLSMCAYVSYLYECVGCLCVYGLCACVPVCVWVYAYVFVCMKV